MTPLNRLYLLIGIHGFQGGTIHQYNRVYNLDWLRIPENDFRALIEVIKLDDNYRREKIEQIKQL
jgi:hypothetical protein